VELQENPAHKRSPLVRLTPAGERKLRAMMDREELLLAQLQLPCSREQVRRAAQVLHSVRLAFEGEQWNRLVRSKY
jgi:DNA-binding MarR family transcriptional regulator